ncbi:MAG: tetratricopeptide repeat protein, partial [Candidatus Eisenbacteria bacterium]|nr:tetratricopeptide repeat protein [Candidatus Eisenbacteria bacterium]
METTSQNSFSRPEDGAGEGLTGTLLRAAGSLLEARQPAAALSCLEQALVLLPVDSQGAGSRGAERGQVLFLTARALLDLGRASEAELRLQGALEIARHAQDLPAVTRNCTELGALLQGRGALDEAQSLLREALLLSASLTPGPDRARALEEMGPIERLKGRLREATDCFEEALRIREALGDRPGIARNHDRLGNLCIKTGRLADAHDHFRTCLSIREAEQDRPGMAVVYNNIGTVLLNQGDYTGAIENFEHAESLFRETGNRRWQAWALGNLGLLWSYRGDAARAGELLTASLEVMQETDDRMGLAVVSNNLAPVFLMSGRAAEAIATAQRSIRLREELGQVEGLAKPWFNMANGYIETGQLEQAEAAAREVRALAQRSESAEILSEALLLEASLAFKRGRAAEAEQRAREAESIATQGKYPRQRAEALRLRAEIHFAQGEIEAAREELLESESVWKELPDLYHLALCRLQLGQLFVQIGAAEAAAERLRLAAEIFRGLLNVGLEWRALVLLAEAEWPVAAEQAGSTLDAAQSLARRHERADLLTETEQIRQRLAQRGNAGASVDVQRLLALSAHLRETREEGLFLRRVTETIRQQLQGEAVIVLWDENGESLDPSFRSGARTSPLVQLFEEVRVQGVVRHRWLTPAPAAGAAAGVAIGVPIRGHAAIQLGVLLATTTETVERVGGSDDPPGTVGYLQVVAEFVGLGVDALRLA